MGQKWNRFKGNENLTKWKNVRKHSLFSKPVLFIKHMLLLITVINKIQYTRSSIYLNCFYYDAINIFWVRNLTLPRYCFFLPP